MAGNVKMGMAAKPAFLSKRKTTTMREAMDMMGGRTQKGAKITKKKGMIGLPLYKPGL